MLESNVPRGLEKIQLGLLAGYKDGNVYFQKSFPSRESQIILAGFSSTSTSIYIPKTQHQPDI